MSFKRGVLNILAAVVMVGALAGCVIEPAGPRGGWCYHHPYRC
jgi:hypothetical protein